MADKELADLLKKQISLTEWLQDIDVDYIDAFRKEDSSKRKTLGEIAEITGWPVEGNVTFEAVDVRSRSALFNDFLQKNKSKLYAMRLLPKEPRLEKIRLRGLSLGELMDWFDQLDVEHDKYEVNIIDHPSDYGWATIFFVNQHGIHGEMIYAGHHLLTQGFHGENIPIIFHFDFKSRQWHLSRNDDSALTYLKKMANHVKVPDSADREKLTNEYGSTFINDYLIGYFETADSSLGMWFIDYNQTLGEKLSDVSFRSMLQEHEQKDGQILKGRSGSPGKATGKVRIIHSPDDDLFEEGEILVCQVTSPDYLQCMQRAAAIITDQGGTLSHAAIVARELNTPCIVATGNATSVLVDGDIVCVNANDGTVVRAV
ncbi:hypothetical protein KA021_02450 [Candidatus Saccharibacteria bacterium]|nr:hypothetical protein [Candidatus Saccharibacteria bacterium]